MDYLSLGVEIAAAGLIVLQIYFLRKQINDGHEEHRRENTTNIMHIWCNSLKKESTMAQDVARKLSEEQCRHLYRREAFAISPDIADSVCKFCPLSKDECEKCSINKEKVVDGKILTELRYHVICYLNMLETVMTSWDLGIVDRDTIENQFQFLVADGKGMALGSFRRAAGGYPLIEKFVDKIKGTHHEPKNPL